MKNLLLLLFMVIIVSCNSDNERTKSFIRNFFDTNFEFACADSSTGKVKLKPLNVQLDAEAMAVVVIVPDSVPYSDFYNAYINRILDVYNKSWDALDKNTRDSLLTSTNCDTEMVKERMKEHYCNDPVFFNVFKTALESFYSNTENKDDVQFSAPNKVKLPMDTLIQVSLLQVDILGYDTDRGNLMYHYVCGVNPYSYSIENSVKLLIPGFCMEAMRNKALMKVHGQIMSEISKSFKEEYSKEKGDIKGLCIKYQDKLRRMLVEEGTLKKSLLDYYEKRKAIEPFILVDDVN